MRILARLIAIAAFCLGFAGLAAAGHAESPLTCHILHIAAPQPSAGDTDTVFRPVGRSAPTSGAIEKRIDRAECGTPQVGDRK